MAIATNGGHVSRALDFLHAEDKYFIIGGTTAWTEEQSPPSPAVTDFKLQDIIGLKRVESGNCYLVRPTTSGETPDVSTKDNSWKRVYEPSTYTVGAGGITAGATAILLTSVSGISVGNKLRVYDLYEGKVTAINGLTVTLDTTAPVTIPAGSVVRGGAYVENAKYVYVSCYLNYSDFPLATYRQVGLCTGATTEKTDKDILKSAQYSSTNANEYTSTGVLEILDNRPPTTRSASMRELISLVIEF